MGKPGYEVTAGSITPRRRRSRRARAVATSPGRACSSACNIPSRCRACTSARYSSRRSPPAASRTSVAAERIAAEAPRLGLDDKFFTRALNVDLSGGEKKRVETFQLAVLRPKIAVLDELDSGLDIDALRLVSRRVEDATKEFDLGVLAITHYQRLLEVLHADHVHIFANGRIKASGGPELASELERTGYAAWADAEAGGRGDPTTIPFADPFA